MTNTVRRCGACGKVFVSEAQLDVWQFAGGVKKERAVAGSVKACFGHTEGAAGIHGALLAMLAVQNSAAPPIMHSRSLNAYVKNAIADWKTSCNLTAVVPKVPIISCRSTWPHRSEVGEDIECHPTGTPHCA